MARSIANLDVLTETFGAWVTRTNGLLDAFSNEVVTANTTLGVTGTNTTPRYAQLVGGLYTNAITISDVLRGGNSTTVSTLNIFSNSTITGNNILLKSNSTITAIAITANSTVTNSTITGDNFSVAANTIIYGSSLSATANSTITAANIVLRSNSSITNFQVINSNTNIGATNLSVAANSTFNGAVTFNGTFNSNVSINVANAINAGNTTITGFINASSTANIGGAVTARSTLTVNGVATFANTVGITGAVTLANTLTVTNATALSNTLTVTGVTTLNNDVVIGTEYLIDVVANNNIGVGNSTVGQTVYSFDKTSYRAAKLMVFANSSNSTVTTGINQLSELIVTHDNQTSAYVTVYGTVSGPYSSSLSDTLSPLGTYGAQINNTSGAVEILMYPVYSNSAVKVVAHLIK